jgi:DNA modification methylase
LSDYIGWDTWTWDDQAGEGFRDIIANEKGRYVPQTVALIKGLRDVLKEGSLLAYLVSMTRRIVEIHRVLKNTGSFYLHCDPASSHYLKVVLDSIFGGNFRNEIIWKRSLPHNDPKRYGSIHDTLLFYTKSDSFTFNQQHEGLSESYIASHYKQTEADGRHYQLTSLAASGAGPARQFGKKMMDPPVGNHWRYSQDNIDRLMLEGRIVFTSTGRPRYKRYQDEMKGAALQSIWTDVAPINSQAQERLGYPTQKPEALLERIIKSSSNEGDLLLDAYCGCGTTVAVAQHLKRKWIGMDITFQSISLILKRLEDAFGKDVAAAVRLNGAPKDMDSATALAHKADDRIRKEFEKWAVLTYTQNRGAINDKKGADAGIDGAAYFLTSRTENDKMVFQVKSGHVGRGDIAKLKGDMQREKAALAMFITLEEPTGPMRSEAKGAGSYLHALTGRRIDQIQIVTVREMLENKKCRMDLPLTLEVLNAAEKKQPWTEQGNLDLKELPKAG